ncbi:hypothetical protein UlMin_013738 [Ulmus minor]
MWYLPKSGQESSDDTDGSHDGFCDNYFDVDYCDSEPTDVGSSRQTLPVFRNAERTSNDNGASVTQPAEGNPPVDPLLQVTGAGSDEPVNVPTIEASDSTFSDGSDLHEGKYFNTKKDLKRKLSDIAMKGNFEFRTRKSNRSLWVIECIDPNCSWRLRASKIVPESTKFVIRKYVGVHSCSLLNRNANHRQATYVVIGEQVAPQYVGVEKGPGPKGVQTFARTELGAQISYYKAWRGRKHAHTLIRGSPEQSFHVLPSYFHMLENRFKYLFLAFGVAIRGFRYMRKVVGIDGTFLKGQYRGVLLVATAQDGNGQCYPLAWGIVDSENEDAWSWFLTQLKEIIGDTDELALISDRAPSIKKAISTVFEKAHHGACAWHVAQNIKNKFKCADIMGSYWSAVNAYRCEDFTGYMIEISNRYPRVAEYLENEVGFEKWSRCHYPGLRYNITTTNMVESLNSMLVNARDFPYVALLDVIQEKMSKWWNDRRIVARAITTPLTPSRESELRPRFAQSNGRHTSQLNPITYHVKDGELEGVVDIFNKTCTCKEFDIDKLPCVHAVAAAHHAQVSVYSLVSPYYTKEYYLLAYGETIYPVGSQSQWDVPNEVVTRIVLPREVKEKKRGRPKTSRFPSVGEFRKRKNRCGKCGAYGHYKKKCNSQTGSTEGNPPTNVPG